jgi:hypothetical protein
MQIIDGIGGYIADLSLKKEGGTMESDSISIGGIG